MHYVIYYTPEGGTEQLIDTGSNLTHYNLTGLERNRVYTIAVQAVNSAGSSVRSTVVVRYKPTPPGESGCISICIISTSFQVVQVNAIWIVLYLYIFFDLPALIHGVILIMYARSITTN